MSANLPSLQDVLDVLRIEPEDIESVIHSNQPNWDAVNEAFLRMVKDKRKRLAQEIHPDKSGDAEKMKMVNQYADLLIGNVCLGPQPQPRPQYIRVVVTNFHNTTSTTHGWVTGGFYF